MSLIQPLNAVTMPLSEVLSAIGCDRGLKPLKTPAKGELGHEHILSSARDSLVAAVKGNEASRGERSEQRSCLPLDASFPFTYRPSSRALERTTKRKAYRWGCRCRV